ncbi:MAG: hypothetical protein ACK5N8_08745 [Alphaproteobacteria bacterium]
MKETIFILNEEQRGNIVVYLILRLYFDSQKICIGAYCSEVEKKIDEEFKFVYYDEKAKSMSKEEIYKKISQISELKRVPFNKFDFHSFQSSNVRRTILIGDTYMLSLDVNSYNICIGGNFSSFRTMCYLNGIKEFVIEKTKTLRTEELLDVITPSVLKDFSLKAETPDRLTYQGKKVNVYPQIIGDQVVLFADIFSVEKNEFINRISGEEYAEMIKFHNYFDI